MSTPFFTNSRYNPELKSLYEILSLPLPKHLQDYFLETMTVLSDHFPVNYSALVLRNPHDDSLSLEGLYGIEKEARPLVSRSRKGVIAEVLQSRKAMAIHNLHQEPFYEETYRNLKQSQNISSPLLCIPLLAETESIGVMNITPLYGSRSDFSEDFHFLSILCALLSPVVKKYYYQQEESFARSGKTKLRSSLLEEILTERLGEVLNRIDPYVETKNRSGLLDDIVSLVERILIKSALEKVNHVQITAAQLLGINRNTLRKKISDLKIKKSEAPRSRGKASGAG